MNYAKLRSRSRAFSVLLLGCFLIGCASRNPVADRRQPPPLEPAPTSAKAEEKARNSTDVAPSPGKPSGSAKRKKTDSIAVPAGYTEEGEASWYGVPFHGRHASNGEIYDMYKLTAAHKTLPFETMVRVTNLNNGKTTTVRITDRGPFVDNRIIDLSFAAAKEIESVGPGVVPVRIEILSPGIDPTVGFFTVQVGAFRERANAERLKLRLDANYSPIFIQQFDLPEGTFYRVRVGKVSGEEAATELGEQLRAKEALIPTVVRLDETPAPGEN